MDEQILIQLGNFAYEPSPGAISLSKSLMKQIGSQGAAFCKKFLENLGEEGRQLQSKFELIEKNPKLTFQQLQGHVEHTNQVVKKVVDQKIIGEWDSLYKELVAKIGVLETCLLADAYSNSEQVARLIKEKELALSHNDKKAAQECEKLIKKINALPAFELSKDNLNTLDAYMKNWNRQLGV